MLGIRLPSLKLSLRRGAPLIAGAIVLALAGGAVAAWQVREQELERTMLDTPANQIYRHPDLIKFAERRAKPVFAKECAQCHGADMKGKPNTGAPNLTDKNWLYGDNLFHIERTILYGIRSGRQKAYDITEMPAYGQRGQLSSADITNVVQYLLQLSGRPFDANAAVLGRQIYDGSGKCYDCHAGDAKGNIDYGATDLTAGVWDYGGSPQQLYDSIYYGRHGIMPAWYGKLSLAQIRAVAIYVHAPTHR